MISAQQKCLQYLFILDGGTEFQDAAAHQLQDALYAAGWKNFYRYKNAWKMLKIQDMKDQNLQMYVMMMKGNYIHHYMCS